MELDKVVIKYLSMLESHRIKKFMHPSLTFDDHTNIAYKDESFDEAFRGKDFRRLYEAELTVEADDQVDPPAPEVEAGKGVRKGSNEDIPRNVVAGLFVNQNSDKILLHRLNDDDGWKFPVFTLNETALEHPLAVLKSKLQRMTGVSRAQLAMRLSPENFVRATMRVEKFESIKNVEIFEDIRDFEKIWTVKEVKEARSVEEVEKVRSDVCFYVAAGVDWLPAKGRHVD